MADTDILQVIAEARVDARSLSEFVFKPANFIVSRRLAPSINTLQYYIDRVNSVNNAFSKSVSDATAAADIAIRAANTANQNAIGLIDSVTNQAAQSVQNAISGVAIDANLVTDALTTISPITTTPTARTQLDKNRESVSVLDFFTAEELAEYLPTVGVANGYYDAYRPLQEFFDYITANDVGTAHCNGNFGTSQAIIIGGATGCITKSVIGNFSLTALNTLPTIIDDLLTFWTGPDFNWTGAIAVHANAIISLNYDRRKVLNGVRIGGIYSATHARLPAITARNGFKNWGVILDNLTTGTVIDKIRVSRCGSGYMVKNYTPYEDSNFTVSSTTPGTSYQRSILAVDNYLDFDKIEGNKYVYIDNNLYRIDSDEFDPIAKTISVFPTLPEGVTSGKLMYVYGGGLFTKGKDASVTNIGNINVSTSGICVNLEALYPPVIDAVTTQNNFLSLCIGGSLSAGIVGGVIGEYYFEANTYDIVQNTRWKSNLVINNTVAVNLDKCLAMANTRMSTGNLSNEYGLTIQLKTTTAVLSPVTSRAVSSEASVEVFDVGENDTMYITGRLPKTINLRTSDFSAWRLFGMREKTLVVFDGTADTIADVTINAPIGSKINGQDSIVISGYVGALIISIYLFRETELSVTVSGSRAVLSAQKTYDAPILDAATTQTTTITLSGAKIGDAIAVSLDQPLLGTRIWGEVTAANLVTVYHRNDTAESVDVASGTLKAKVL